eukprot:886245_1
MSAGQIKEWAQAQENLDIYQINAFLIGTGQRRYYPIGVWKLMACIGLQIFGIIFLTTETWDSAGFGCGDAAVCQGYNGDTLSVAWMAFFFVSFVSINCAEELRNLGNYGMYGWGPDQPEFVSKILVALGLYANIIVLILSWLCSSIVVFASKDMLEMVLNSVAVLFMITIDDEIVGFSDYNNVMATMTTWSSSSKASAVLDKIATTLLKIQILWSKPMVCTFIITPLTIIAP